MSVDLSVVKEGVGRDPHAIARSAHQLAGNTVSALRLRTGLDLDAITSAIDVLRVSQALASVDPLIEDLAVNILRTVARQIRANAALEASGNLEPNGNTLES